MKRFNSPITALLALAGFFFIAGYANSQPTVAVKKSEQLGYQVGSNRFVGFKLDHFHDVATYHMTPASRQQAMNELWGAQ